MLFPVSSLDQVVPPGLHIMLGVVLLIYNLLLNKCKLIDDEENVQQIALDKEKTSEQWEESSMDLLHHTREMEEHAETILEMEKNLNHYEIVSTGVVVMEDGKCEATCCLILNDDNPGLVICNQCNKTFHTKCEALSTSEGALYGSDKPYSCQMCSGYHSLQDVFHQKLASLLDEEDHLKKTVVEAETLCDNLKARYERVTGVREKMLNAALDNIKVVHQAYHGNVMVGNYCHIVLKHFTKLTRVLGDRDDELLFNEIFGLFKDITMLMSAPRFLNDQEIDRLEELF